MAASKFTRLWEMDPKLIKYHLFLPILMLAYFLLPWAALILTGVPGIVPWSCAARLALGCLALTQILTTVAGYRFVEILFQLRPSHRWAHPLGAVALGWVQWEACYRLFSGRKAVWKGREYRQDSK